jgi:hypothetical protein
MSDPCDRDQFYQAKYDVTRLFDYVQALVPGLTSDMAALTIWQAIEDFYIRSAYRREHVYWCLNPGETTLNFDPYDSAWRVCWFMGFRGLGNPKFIPPGKVVDLTCPVPDSVRNGEAVLALKPDSFETELPYDVMTTYWEAIASGALYRLHLQPGKPYSDLNAAQIHAKMNRSGIASARANAQAQHLGEAAPWSYPYFATGGGANGR